MTRAEIEDRLNRCRECVAQRKGPCYHDDWDFAQVLGGRP